VIVAETAGCGAAVGQSLVLRVRYTISHNIVFLETVIHGSI